MHIFKIPEKKFRKKLPPAPSSPFVTVDEGALLKICIHNFIIYMF